MSFHSMRLAFAAVLIGLLVCGCGGTGSPAPPPAGGITVTPGDGQVTITWIPDPGVTYWLFFAQADSISTESLSTIAHQGRINVTSPYVVNGLTNGLNYSFTIDGRYDDGPGGDGTPSVSALPRPAGTTWTAGTGMGTADMRGTAYGPTSLVSSSYISVGDGGAMYQSADGASWTAVTGSGITSTQNAAVYTLGSFITVGASGSSFYSSDAITWSVSPTGTTQNLNAVATNGGLAVAVGDGGTIVYTASPASWAPATSVPTSNNLYGVTYSSASGAWFAVGTGGVMLASTDGITWTAVTTGAPAVDLKSIAFRPAVYIVDPVTKVATLYPAALVAVGAGGTVLTSTTTNPTWTAQTLSPAADLSAVVPTASLFLAVGAGGAAFASQDGSIWTPRSTGTSANLLGLFDAQGQYIAVGQGGATIYSR